MERCRHVMYLANVFLYVFDFAKCSIALFTIKTIPAVRTLVYASHVCVQCIHGIKNFFIAQFASKFRFDLCVFALSCGCVERICPITNEYTRTSWTFDLFEVLFNVFISFGDSIEFTVADITANSGR